MKIRNNNLFKGSATVVVIFSSLAASIYMVSAFADYEHYNIMLSKFENNTKQHYKQRVENVDNYYTDFTSIIETNENFILE